MYLAGWLAGCMAAGLVLGLSHSEKQSQALTCRLFPPPPPHPHARSTQYKTVLDALRGRKERFLFEDVDIALKPSVMAFITMNPGYPGRAELPESLKALFRPVSMVLPDLGLICEIMLVGGWGGSGICVGVAGRGGQRWGGRTNTPMCVRVCVGVDESRACLNKCCPLPPLAPPDG